MRLLHRKDRKKASSDENMWALIALWVCVLLLQFGFMIAAQRKKTLITPGLIPLHGTYSLYDANYDIYLSNAILLHLSVFSCADEYLGFGVLVGPIIDQANAGSTAKSVLQSMHELGEVMYGFELAKLVWVWLIVITSVVLTMAVLLPADGKLRAIHDHDLETSHAEQTRFSNHAPSEKALPRQTQDSAGHQQSPPDESVQLLESAKSPLSEAPEEEKGRIRPEHEQRLACQVFTRSQLQSMDPFLVHFLIKASNRLYQAEQMRDT
ncbi:hypothetical protein BDZ45DRAFT_736498 [Acephala macrosclerotiorum]|nr:hypothetical protein BDZ45DRAFT_736498 [Acephala macrosclerotiorum]